MLLPGSESWLDVRVGVEVTIGLRSSLLGSLGSVGVGAVFGAVCS